MKSQRFFILLTLISLTLCQNDAVTISVRRSKVHADKTGDLTPLVATISSKDQTEKIRAVDLICIVDVSGSMSGDNIKLVKESLSYLVSIMNEQDNLALVTFDSSARVVTDFLAMNEENKVTMTNMVENLYANGGTNIFSGLEMGLSLLKKEYSEGDRVASMILLSDGQDNYGFQAEQFKNLLITENKDNFLFTLHSFGYGNYHDANLMYEVSLIKDGGYFFIKRLSSVQDAFLKIYGSLSTNCEINVQFKITSNYEINKVYGMEYMNEPLLTNSNKDFTTTLIQFIYGKNYNFVFLVDIPKGTPSGTEILTVEVSPFGKKAVYILDESLSSMAYEEYIRSILVVYFIEAYEIVKTSYNNGQNSIELINEGIEWIKNNYVGTRNWEDEFNGVIEDLRAYGQEGIANLLSKIRELSTTQLGIHYNDNENSFIVKIIEESHNLDLTGFIKHIITALEKFTFEEGNNYYYFNLKNGTGEINDIHFSGSGSSFIYYSNDPSDAININPLTSSLECYSSTDYSNKPQFKINFMQGGQFVIKENFPIAFYVLVDGTKDITFNFRFLDLEPNNGDNFTISAHIIEEERLEYMYEYDEYDYYDINRGYLEGNVQYDKKLKLGKIIIKKDKINALLYSNAANYYLYIVLKPSNSERNFTKIQGQCSFVSMDNIFSPIPEGFYIFSNLEPEQKTPHLYSLKMEPVLGKRLSIEFENPGGALDAKLLTYKNYPTGSEELYSDYSEFEIERSNSNDKTYITLKQASESEKAFDFVIVSIFPKNREQVSNSTKLDYTLIYKTDSDYGIEERVTTEKTQASSSSFLSTKLFMFLLLSLLC